MSKPDDQTETDRISLDKTKMRDIKSTQNNEVDNEIDNFLIIMIKK